MRIVAALALAVVLPACGSSEPAATRQTQTPSPAPTLPPVADDEAKVKAALVTAGELGSPWIKPKSVNEAKRKKGERCPGQQNARTIAKARAEAETDLSEGTQVGAAIGSFGVRAYAFGEERAWKAANDASANGCLTWNAAEGTFVALEIVPAPAVPGADEVHATIERVYQDSTKQNLYYVRHYYEARTGRIVSTFEYAFVQPATDPTGKDLTASSALLAKQVAKTRTTFGL